jgi:beta-hydroxylase
MLIVIITIAIVLLTLLLYYIHYNNNLSNNSNLNSKQLDKKFYQPNEISSDLNKIYGYDMDLIRSETRSLSNWLSWPETELYEVNNPNGWKVIPFYGFGTWVDQTCNKCPTISNFLRQIRGLKLATLSKLSPGMKLVPHKGWANHSNYVIRCHFGIVVPSGCYISVQNNGSDVEEIRFHKENEWLIFDDSKIHYAENKSASDRIVLIVDIERPAHIRAGVSDSEDSKELLDFIDQFKVLLKNGS